MSRAIDVRGARDAASTLENRAKIDASIVQPIWTPHASREGERSARAEAARSRDVRLDFERRVELVTTTFYF